MEIPGCAAGREVPTAGAPGVHEDLPLLGAAPLRAPFPFSCQAQKSLFVGSAPGVSKGQAVGAVGGN